MRGGTTFPTKRSLCSLRRHELNDLATLLHQPFKNYKTKQDLIAQIRTCPHWDRYLRCYNSKDVYTLDELHTIPPNEYVEWTQDMYTFGARLHSMYTLIHEKQVYMNPYAVDLSSDLDFDLRNVMSLQQDLERYKSSAEEHNSSHHSENVSADIETTFVFDIDALCGKESGYIHGTIVNKLLQETSVVRIMSTMYRSICHVWNLLLSNVQTQDSYVIDAFFHYILCAYEQQGFSTFQKTDQLVLIRNMCTEFHQVVGSVAHGIIFLLFNDM